MKNSEIKKVLGERIHDLRIKQGIDAMTFCAIVGISRQKLASLEKGKAAIDYIVLCSIAKTLNASTEYLFGITDTYRPLR